MATHSLYNGTVELVFDERRHRYSVDGDWKPGVTTVLGVALNKADMLVPWAVNKCIEHLSTNLVPNTPYSDDELTILYAGAKSAHRVFKETAGEIGTQAHKWLEEYQRSLLYDTSAPELPEDERVRNAVESPLSWFKDVGFTPLTIERPIYSRTHGYAGTLDGIAMIEGKKVLFDFKTSKGLYNSYHLQVEAYRLAVEEEGEMGIASKWLLRLGKEDGSFESRQIPKSANAADKKAFLACLELYNWNRKNQFK